MILLTSIGLIAIYTGAKKKFAFILYFGFVLFILQGFILFGEGITQEAKSFSIDTSTDLIDGNFIDGSLKTTTDSSVLLLANLYFYGGLVGSLYFLLMYQISNRTGTIREE